MQKIKMSSYRIKWISSLYFIVFIHTILISQSEPCFRLKSQQEHKPWEPRERSDSWWQKTHEHFVNTSATSGKDIRLLFYGDSITEGWYKQGLSTFQKHYLRLGAVNYGISGDRTEHLLWRIRNKEVLNINPKVIVLMIGTNNMAYNSDPDTAKAIRTIVHELQTRLPQSKILLLGILPKSNSDSIINRIDGINRVSATMEDHHMIRYLNMKYDFCTDYGKYGMPNPVLYYSDLLHLSAKGYEKWAEIMNPLLTEMLGGDK